MNLAILGCGYVGLVSGTCLSSLGHHIIAVDVDEARVAKLREGIVPIYEPGLSELIKNEVADGRLEFSTDIAAAVKKADTIFLAVGTPPAKEGGYDLTYLFSAAETVAKAADGPRTLVVKSTVNPGTGSRLAKLVSKLSPHRIEVVNNPEFLREGTAIRDFLQPDRIVFGANSAEGVAVLREIYQPLIDQGYPIFSMSRESAEMTKFAANAMLAMRISFMNELSQLAQAIGADIESVRIGIGSDDRIGPKFLRAGVGYGGSCFPKDVQALCYQMRCIGIEPLLLSGIEQVNWRQKVLFAKRILAAVQDIEDPVVAVWGLAFKSDTDDVREAPAFDVIKMLVEGGATVKAYDPEAMENTQRVLSSKITYCKSVDECTQGADAVALLTDWPIFITQDWKRVASLMRGARIFDGRNCLASGRVTAAGLHYHAIGRPELRPGEGRPGAVGIVAAG